MTRPNAELLTMPVGDSLDIADALDREIETVLALSLPCNGFSLNTAVNPTSTVRYVLLTTILTHWPQLDAIFIGHKSAY